MTIRQSLAAVAVVTLAACGGMNTLEPTDPSDPTQKPVCQTGNSCCTSGQLTCHGDPDGKMVCSCYLSWACDNALNAKKCTQTPADTPTGETGWSCVVKNGMDVCTHSGNPEVPTGKNGWVCTDGANSVTCQRPTNTPGGGANWSCSYSGDVKTCTTTPKTDSGVPKTDSGVPKTDTGTTPAWDCTKDALGNQICKQPGGGLPPGGGTDWKCYWKNGTMICEGPSSTPPGGGGWTCVANEDVGGYKCTKPVGPNDTPPGAGKWDCFSSSDVGGIMCTLPPTPGPGQVCIPGQKRWCDGEVYCSYAQQVCLANGQWDPKCVEAANGVRPNTVCACYFFYFNKDCCETPDCIVPPGTNGQVCPASPGLYCDFCNPEKNECKQGKCIITPKNETFCGKSCSTNADCGAGAMCTVVQTSAGDIKQCIPTTQSCYYK
jgi:hypothetical protein